MLGRKKITPLGNGLFAYKNQIYDVEELPPQASINIDSVRLEPVGPYEGKTKKQKLKQKVKKKYRKNYIAHLYSNLEDCPDALELLQENSPAA